MIESVGFLVCELMLVQGQVDVIFGFLFFLVLNFKFQGVLEDDILLILMGENGFDFYGNVVIVNIDFVVESLDVVKGFIKVLIKGYLDVIVDLVVVIFYVMKCNEIFDEVVEVDCLIMVIDGFIVILVVKENGFGGVDMDKFVKFMEYLQVFMGVSVILLVVDWVFDVSYLFLKEEWMVK